MSKKIKFDKRSNRSAYVTVNGKTIYIEDFSATEGLYISVWKDNKWGTAGDAISLHSSEAGIYTESE